ncbi:hypothetical protein MIZ01_0293 [Sideroxyarcus emersonii]|uniref:VWFA domain-containing protein n=1 Tax=Sideroxyarcus emersonii TaxID=2764705 RepID=A0AAN1X7R7_9PROT|nr:VWA domain-containing protein [Sideroxyarcus emersonii]BCK86531.1 hypothetical protein MIZ01_0293 [Sideroxyarcus emersonii]
MNSLIHRYSRKLQDYLARAPRQAAGDLPQAQQTRLGDVQRRIAIYLRGLWDRDFVIKPLAGDAEKRAAQTPRIENGEIHLPAAYADLPLEGAATPVPGLELFRAAAAHAAAHIVYTQHPFAAKSLDKWQRATVAAIEDARVEALAIRRFPGLKKLWIRQHTITPAHGRTAEDYLDRLARALLDDAYRDDDPWIAQGRELFKAAADLQDARLAWDIGIALAPALRDKKLKFKLPAGMHGAPYRDDNRSIWMETRLAADKAPVAPTTIFESELFSIWEFARFGSGRKKRSRLTFYNPEFLEAQEDQPGTGEAGEDNAALESDDEGRKILASLSDAAGNEQEATYSYSEWNFRSQLETESWVTVREKNLDSGDLQIIDDIIERHYHLLARMKALLNAIRYGGMHRIRKLEEGDDIDINAAIRAQVDLRLGVQPDPRIMMRSLRKTRDISVLLLLDLSDSTNEKVQGQEHTVLQLTQQVCALFADAIETVGDPFAIHGFCSESRHNVEYYRLKDFDQPYDDVPKARIAGMTGQRATRMGAAIRHASYHLNRQQSRKKLLILITDGAPDDVDVRGEEYLLSDTKKAVEGASRSGIKTFCISLDHSADRYVARIFGARNYMVVDHVRHLPEKMLMLYAGLTR